MEPTHILDNPSWASLTGPHAQFAIRHGLAARYKSDYFIGSGIGSNEPAALEDLKAIFGVGEWVGLFGGVDAAEDPDWRVEYHGPAPQLWLESPAEPADIGAVPLTEADVPDMLALIELTKPGPFLPKTIQLGGYIGVRDAGKLVAMAGQRMHPPGYCEVSAVCTHPDYRGRGYGGALTLAVAKGIQSRGEIPFLHLDPSNETAMRLYKKLGFQLRKMVTVTFMMRVA